MEENGRGDAVKNQMIAWIEKKGSRKSTFRVYKIEAYKYGIPTTRVRTIFTNFDMDGETNLVLPPRQSMPSPVNSVPLGASSSEQGAEWRRW